MACWVVKKLSKIYQKFAVCGAVCGFRTEFAVFGYIASCGAVLSKPGRALRQSKVCIAAELQVTCHSLETQISQSKQLTYGKDLPKSWKKIC